MGSQGLLDRLRRGESLLLDGGTGSELQRRGVDVLQSAPGDLIAWSALANVEAPDAVRGVHEDYLRAGADIVTSNNFWTCPSRLAKVGLASRWEDYARAAGEHALQARAAVNPAAYVAGGIAPPVLERGTSDVEVMGVKAFKAEIRDHATLLTETGVDVILLEYMSHIADSVAAVEACAETALPVFLGVCRVGSDGAMRHGERLEDLGVALQGLGVDAVLLHCSDPDSISAGMPLLRRSYAGTAGAYPDIGYHPTSSEYLLNDRCPPLDLAKYARGWIDMGVQIVGGCCATGPGHIEAMAPVVKRA
jgi:S-methylmethionine-dependent homocysteine/selenocysteine methylase